MPLSTIFQLILWQKPEYPEKKVDLLTVTDKLVESITPHHQWDSNSQLVVVGIDCTSSCNSNYQITTARFDISYVYLYVLNYIYRYKDPKTKYTAKLGHNMICNSRIILMKLKNRLYFCLPHPTLTRYLQ
jgi:hypothetical protein